MNKRRGQASLEFLIIFSIALLILTPILLYSQNLSIDLIQSSRVAIVKETLNKIKNAAEFVYSQEYPSRIPIEIEIPQGVNKTTVNGREISIDLEGRYPLKLFVILDFNVTGNLPVSQGRYKIMIKKEDNYVNITTIQ